MLVLLYINYKHKVIVLFSYVVILFTGYFDIIEKYFLYNNVCYLRKIYNYVPQ